MNQTMQRYSIARSIELVFWDIYIYILSKSMIVRKVFKFFASMSITYDISTIAQKAALISVSGMLFGSAISLSDNLYRILSI